MNSILENDIKDNTQTDETLTILNDRKEWKEKKLLAIELAKSYLRLDNKKHYRVAECSSFLEFKKYIQTNEKKLFNANFCKVRLCPMCSWRRSLKIFGQASKVMDKALESKDYEFLFLTLTVKNCKNEELSDTLDKMFYAFKKLTLKSKFKKAVKGWFRALEVTHNTNKYSKSFDTYHPHFHCILQVDKGYFKKDSYIKQKEWVSLWQDVMKLDYKPLVDIRKFDTSTEKKKSKSLAEAAKYPIKPGDFIVQNKDGKVNMVLTDTAVRTLDEALHSRRLIAYGGMLKDIHKSLNLDDAETGDFVDTDNEKTRSDLDYIIERYGWNIGYSDYTLKSVSSQIFNDKKISAYDSVIDYVYVDEQNE